jgi:hypothetical protein
LCRERRKEGRRKEKKKTKKKSKIKGGNDNKTTSSLNLFQG